MWNGLDDMYNENFSPKIRGPKVPDSHLQSPIRKDNRDFLSGTRFPCPKFLDRCIRTCPIPTQDIEFCSEGLYGYLFQCSLKYEGQIDGWTVTHYNESADVVAKQIELQMIELNLPKPASCMTYAEREFRLLTAKRKWELVKSQMKDRKLGGAGWSKKQTGLPGVFDYFLSPHYLLVQFTRSPQRWFCFDYDQVMMISDTITSRVVSILYNSSLPAGTPGKIPTEFLENVYDKYDNLLVQKGNQAYSEIALWEAGCVSVMYDMHDRLDSSKDYVRWFKDHTTEKQFSTTQDIFLCMRSIEPDMCQLAELHGIYRHWGHPTVDEALGCEKVRTIGTTRNYPLIRTILKMTGAAKRQFVASFVSKHGCWPRIIVPQDYLGQPIAKLIREQSSVLNFYSPEYPLEHWGAIKFHKEFDFDYHEDFTSLIEDRSISCYRSELRTAYNSDILGYKVKKATSYRRLLQEILARPDINVEKICNRILDRNVPFDWKIVLIHAKERELKISPRLFAMMPLEMRLYFCVTESNIAKNIFPYFPQQTMNLDESELHKRLYYLSRTKGMPKEFAPVLVGIDFSSWNLTWVKEATDPIFEMIDDLHGTPGLFTYTHQFFSDSLISLASSLNPPHTLLNSKIGDPPPCNELWYGHMSGFEGLRQKGWTLCTIALLLLVEQETGMKSYVIGQGDNQVCKLMVPIPKGVTVDEYLDTNQNSVSQDVSTFMAILSERAGEAGLLIKQEETSTSTDVMIYGKEILYKGAYMTQGIKRISRTLPDTNETFPNLHTRVATLQTAGFSCSQKTVDMVTPYFISTVEALVATMDVMDNLYKAKKISSQEHDMCTSKKFKNFLLLLNSEIAGYPILSFYHMLYRGCPDPLTTSLTTLFVIAKTDNTAYRLYKWLTAKMYTIGKGEPELLISNPKSLNLKVPTTVSSKLRYNLERVMTKGVKNIHLQQIFNTTKLNEDKKLYDYLIQTRPLAPRVLHELFRNTEAGGRLSFYTKFHNTKTIQDLFYQDTDTINFQKEIEQVETASVKFWIHMYLDIQLISLRIPRNLLDPTILAKQLRDDTWADTVDFAHLEGVTIPSPVHQFKCHPIFTADDHKNHSCPEYLIFTTITPLTKHDLVSRGPYQVYVGSHTREKTTGRLFQLPIISRPLMAATRLEQIRGWTIHPNTRMNSVVDRMIRNRTNLDVYTLSLSSREISGGSVTHRLDDHVTKRETLHNSRANHTTHIWFSSDNMGRLSRGQDNYNIHYQGAIHLGHTWYLLNSVHNGDPITNLKVCYSCDQCEEILDDPLLINDEPAPPLTSMKDNPLIYTRVENASKSLSRDGKGLVDMTHKALPSQAIAFILFSRLLGHMNSFILGITETSSPGASVIGIAEVTGVGVEAILRHLAMYLFLYLPKSDVMAEEVLAAIHPSLFSDLASVCLLPEVLKSLTGMTGYKHTAGLYWSRDGMCQLLKRMLDSYIMELYKDKALYTQILNLPFFPTTNIGQYKILSMWARQVYMATGGRIDLDPLLKKVRQAEGGIVSGDFIDRAIIESLSSELIIEHGIHLYQTIVLLSPLRLSVVPPEVLSRNGRKNKLRISAEKIKTSILPVEIITENYPLELTCIDSSNVIISGDWEIMAPLSENKEKTRTDQVYRLYGDVSTTFSKVMEIMVKEGVEISGNAVTLAEGEGSISRMLYHMGATTIYYNTLINKTDLVPQRGVNILPSYMSDYPEDVRWGEELLMTGGDLCDPSTLNILLAKCPSSSCIVTCDAESPRSVNPITTNKLLLATLAIAEKVKSQTVLFKAFCENDLYLSCVVGTLFLGYNVVKIIVPHFSSHESYEVYLLCCKPKTMFTSADYVHMHRTNTYLRSQGSVAYRKGIKKFISNRIQSHPLQKHIKEILPKFWVASERLGFSDNAIVCLERITVHVKPYDGSEVKDWIKSVRRLAVERARRVLGVQSISYHCMETSQVSAAHIPKKFKLSNQIERFMLSIINCGLILSIEDAPKTNAQLLDQLVTPCLLKSHTQLLYKYSPPVYDWMKSYLKVYRRLEGHKMFSSQHGCSISW